MYLDTSALVPIHVEERSSSVIGKALAKLPDLPMISDYGAGEFAAVISRYVRMNKIPEGAARTILDQFDDWIVTSADVVAVGPRDIRRATSIVRRFDLKFRMPDALHVAICANHDLSMMTRDRDMAAAATALGLTVSCLA